MADDVASRDASESVINAGRDTSRRINDNTLPSAMVATRSRRTELRHEQQQQKKKSKTYEIVLVVHQVIQLALHFKLPQRPIM